MELDREWMFCGSMDDADALASNAVSNIKAMLKVLDLMEEDDDPSLRQAMRLLLQSTWSYCEMIAEWDVYGSREKEESPV